MRRVAGGDRLALLVGDAGALAGPRGARVAGHVPVVVALVEAARLLDVVAGPHVGLHPEQVLGVAEVVLQVVGHVLEVGEQVGEGVAVGLDDRVVDRHHVEVDGAVVGVDHRLHRVAHVVEVVVEAAAVGELRRCRPSRRRGSGSWSCRRR